MWKRVCVAAFALAMAYSAPALAIGTNVTANAPPGETGGGTITLQQKDANNQPVGKPTVINVSRGRSTGRAVMQTEPNAATVDATIKTSAGEQSQTGIGIALFNQGGSTKIGDWTIGATPQSASTPSRARPVTTAVPATQPGGSGRPSGMTFGMFVGWAGANSNFLPHLYTSNSIDEPTQHVSRTASGDSATVTGTFGYNVPNSSVGFEAAVTYLGNKSKIQGLPGNQFAVSANDSLTVEKDWMVTLTGFHYFDGPVPESNWFVKGGIAIIGETITHNCPTSGWCGAGPPGTPLTASDSHINLGLVAGGGFQKRIPPLFGHPSYLRLYYEHVFVGNYDVFTGSRATRAIIGNVDQDMDRFAVGVVSGIDAAAMELYQQYRTPSDIRLKRDISRVGQLDNGLSLYRYKYLWSEIEYVGVMAQEAAQLRPEAVTRGSDGYLRVNYALLGTSLRTWEDWQRAR